MKKTALLFVAALVIMANIDFIWPFTTERTDGDVFGQGLNTAVMLTYQDPDIGFTVRYPSFFAVQPDSLDEWNLNHGDRHLTQAWVKGPVPMIHSRANQSVLRDILCLVWCGDWAVRRCWRALVRTSAGCHFSG